MFRNFCSVLEFYVQYFFSRILQFLRDDFLTIFNFIMKYFRNVPMWD